MNAMMDLIDKGVSQDLSVNRYQTAMDLETYCYGVAGTVGIACLPIFGVPVDQGRNFAIRLGIAVQWTNVIRDVGVDAKMGRIYLPLEQLERFGYTENELFESKNSPNFQALMAYEYDVAKSHYKRARDLFPAAWKSKLLPARIMGAIYERMLEKIKNRAYPVLQEKIRLNLFEKGLAVAKAIRE
jgi:15-cis-phytoene synthase